MNGPHTTSASANQKQVQNYAKTMARRVSVVASVGLIVFSISMVNKRKIESTIDHVYLNLQGELSVEEKGTLEDAVKKIDSALPWTFSRRLGISARDEIRGQLIHFDINKQNIDRMKTRMPENDGDISPTMKQYYESSIERDEMSYKRSTSILLDKLNYIRRNM
jgi:hypothetical protein